MSIALALSSSDPQNLHLLERVERAIRMKTGVRIIDLRVKIDEGCLVVSGRTNSYYNKQLATQAVRGADLKMTVQNELEVS